MSKSKVSLVVALVLLAGAAALVFYFAPEPNRASSVVNADVASPAYCTAAAATTAIGSVEYPVAPKYAALRGLGMLFTARDCGAARFAEVSKGLDYGLVGGRLNLKDFPSAKLRTTLESAGFICAAVGKSPSTASCEAWRLNAAPEPQKLIELQPYFEEIAGEDCSACG